MEVFAWSTIQKTFWKALPKNTHYVWKVDDGGWTSYVKNEKWTMVYEFHTLCMKGEQWYMNFIQCLKNG